MRSYRPPKDELTADRDQKYHETASTGNPFAPGITLGEAILEGTHRAKVTCVASRSEVG
jgi:hypothetical protein